MPAIDKHSPDYLAGFKAGDESGASNAISYLGEVFDGVEDTDIYADYFNDETETTNPLTETLAGLELHLSNASDELRDAGDETNPIIFAESGPNRFAFMSLFFNDSDGVRIEQDLDLNTIAVQLFNDSESMELTEGALYDWAIDFFKNN